MRTFEPRRADASPLQHFKRPAEHSFTPAERERVTLLYGGLTAWHDRLVKAGLEGLGYAVELIPVPTKADFQAGREVGNNGQCNPTYFTVGALLNHLKRKRDAEDMPTDRILSEFVFITVGTCGPCRFGMYEAEFRLALRNAGFDGFRVILLDQTGGVDPTGGGAGLEVNPQLWLTALNAIFLGDLLNAVLCHTRPYEVQAGSTIATMERCVAICEDAMRSKGRECTRPGVLARMLGRVAVLKKPDDLERLLDQLRGRHYVEALARCRALIDAEVEVDYTRPRPVVKITGEFWAQTTEGDGNFRMFSFLEGEGAEVLAEPVATWIDYMIHAAEQRLEDGRGLHDGTQAAALESRIGRLGMQLAYLKRSLAMQAGRRIIAREFERMRTALGGTAQPLANQPELRRLGHPFYNSRASGGEGFLEVAKNIYYFNRRLAHMTLSLKPFGCMPSTQSDGAQAAVVAHYPEMIYLPIETSGEGDINAYSRVQMALGEAKSKCKEEFRSALLRSGYTIEDIRAYVTEHQALRRPLQAVLHVEGVIGRAARFVLHAAALMDRDPQWRMRKDRGRSLRNMLAPDNQG